MTPPGVNHNLKSTYRQKKIIKPHTGLHTDYLPKKMQSYNYNWIKLYAMAG
jgi:hypothetical protein